MSTQLEVKPDHLNITVTNFYQTVDWYSRVFGFELVEEGVRRGHRWGIINKGEFSLCIYEYSDLRVMRESDPEHNTFHRMAHFSFRIEDKKAWEMIMEKERVRLHHTWKYPHSYSWYISDPSGYEIEVSLWEKGKADFTNVQ